MKELEELCQNCVIHSDYCNIIKCNQYEKLTKELENKNKFDLYICTDEKETYIRTFNDNSNILPIKEFIENFLDTYKIEYEKLFFYRNMDDLNEIVINYGGQMYFIAKER